MTVPDVPDAPKVTGRTDPARASDADSSSQVALGAGIAGGAVVLFLLLRIMAIAHWDWFVAGDIADSMNFGDAIGVVLGTLFARPTITAIAVMLLMPLAGVDLVWSTMTHRRLQIGRALFVAFLTAALVALTTTIHVWWLPTGVVVIGALLALMRAGWSHGVGHRLIVGLLRATGVLSATAALLFAVLIDTPWLIREQIETEQETIDGYVLETPSGFLKVLTDDPREVRILISGDVLSRTIGQ